MGKKIVMLFICVPILSFSVVYLSLCIGAKACLTFALGSLIGYIVRGLVENQRRKMRYLYRKPKKFRRRMLS